MRNKQLIAAPIVGLLSQRQLCRLLLCVLILFFACSTKAADLSLLFMGDNGHHRPGDRFVELAPVLARRGVELKYTDRMEDINPETLARFDGLVLYANIDRIEDAQAEALLDYVAAGNGFIPLHCGTYCWRNNRDVVALMGGQFQRHGGQVFTTQIAEPQHPIMEGYSSFTSWDETYIHHLHNEKNRTVLEYRVEGDQAEGNSREPWTWVRTHGNGRVFYTAWGHDQRTFTQPGFHNLVERGIRWACGDDPGKVPSFSDPDTFATPRMTALRKDVAKFEYVDVGPKIPHYTQGEKWGEQGKPHTLMQKPLPSEESIKHFVTPEGVAVRLYADEKSFQAKPIAMTWDERGRLWVCETVDYPNELGGNRDRIRICEDTDGDHVADRFTVFAEGLSIPTAIVIVRGGAVVQNGTETVYLKDTDGDDVSDQKTTLISNWKLGDTHGGVSNFRYGLDNWIWAMQGYNNSSPEYDGKKAQSFRMGFWRFRLSNTDPPKVTDLEFIRSSDNNTWGLGISEDGLIFGSTANHNPSMFVPIPNRYYEQVRGWAPDTLHSIADTYKFKPITENVRQVDQFGGYTAGAGHAIYTARAFPQQWWNRTAFVCGPTGHLVGTFVLRRDGANYKSTSPINLLASDDEWSAPIMAEVGPDGAVWVIDWYNYIIQHNPTPQGFETGKGNAYVSDLRDKKHGRIYRVVALSGNPTRQRGADTDGTSSLADASGYRDSLHEFSSLADATNLELVSALKHPSMRWRLHAQRLLIERQAGRDGQVLEPLLALLADESVDAAGLNPGAIHALHTLKGLGYLSLNPRLKSASRVVPALTKAMEHPSAAVRRNTLAVMPADARYFELPRALKSRGTLAQEDAQVQLQWILNLARMPHPDDAEAAGLVAIAIAGWIEQTKDPVLQDALTAAAANYGPLYLNALCEEPVPEGARMVGFDVSGEWKTDRRGTVGPANLTIATRVAEHVARSRPDANQLEGVLRGLARADSALQAAILDGLTAGIPSRFEFEATRSFEATLVTAFKQGSAGSKSKLIRLAAQCHTKALDEFAEEIVTAMLSVIEDADADEKDRAAAARELIGFRSNDTDAVESIVEQLGAQTTPDLGGQLLQAIRLSQSVEAGNVLLGAVPSLTPQLKSAAIDALLSRPDWAKSLLEGLQSRDVELAELSLDQKQSLRSFPDASIRGQAEKLLSMGGGLPDADRDKVLQMLLPLTEKDGNVDAGREMFKKHCAACHQHGELGKTIGPNLTGMAVHPKAELLTHIIDPSRSVEGNFRIYTVVTSDGRVMNGMLASETRTSITLIDSKAKETSIQREDIDELIASRKSLMPEGFEKQMSEEEFTNLLEFLTNKGRFVPVPLDKYATAISTKGLFHEGDNGPDRMIFPDWKPKFFKDIPFLLTDPQGGSRANIVLLHGPLGTLPPKMPEAVSLPCNTAAKSIHLLSGVGGWSYPATRGRSVSMTVRLNYEDGESEDHALINGVHFADYIRRVDVEGSEFAFALGSQQIRYLSITPKRDGKITTIELIKGDDNSSPIVMAVTIER